MNLNSLFDEPGIVQYHGGNYIDVVSILKEQMVKESEFVLEPADTATFRASGIGSCGREQLIKLNGASGNQDAGSTVTLSVGTAIHEIIQGYLVRAGVIESLEVKTDIIPGLTGSYDGILKVGKLRGLFELKTMNVFAYQRQVLYNKIYPKYIKQINAYMGGLGLDFAVILFLNKNGILDEAFAKENPEIDPVFHQQIVKFDPVIWEEIKNKVTDLTEHFKNKTLPPKVVCSACNYCRVKDICNERHAIEKVERRELAKAEKAAAKPIKVPKEKKVK